MKHFKVNNKILTRQELIYFTKNIKVGEGHYIKRISKKELLEANK